MTKSETYTINADQVRTAWKMLETLSDEYALSPREQSFLLHAVNIVALHHSLSCNEVRWKGMDQRLRIFCEGRLVGIEEDAPHPLVLHPSVTEEEADASFSMVEQLLDHHEIPEHERAGLYSALPCLGLHALQDRYIEWNVVPPFKGLIGKSEKRKKK
ncbi:MAG TPA: hypothetical protein VGL91_26215 [Acidobacteriota bacterium]|jgi:hypothetical protein